MKNFTRLLALVLAVLMLVTCFVACGDQTPDDTTNQPTDTKKPAGTGRDAIEDGIPAELTYASASGNTVTFFVRNNAQLFSMRLLARS